MFKSGFLVANLLAFGLAGGNALAQSASLLPNGEQTFIDSNGAPLAGGSVCMYIPNTLTAKQTWKDPGATQLNASPCLGLDAAGRAIIYGEGVYRQRVLDLNGNLVWDQLTTDLLSVIGSSSAQVSWGGTSTGSGNSQLIVASPSLKALAAGQIFSFIAGASNTSAVTLAISGLSGAPVVFGQGPLVGGEITKGALIHVVYDGANFQLVNQHSRIDPRWFGATPGGATGPNNSAALQAAFTLAYQVNSAVWIPPGPACFRTDVTIYAQGGPGVTDFYGPSVYGASNYAANTTGSQLCAGSGLGGNPILKYQGGSGSLSGVIIDGISFIGAGKSVTGQAGVELQDMDGVTLHNVGFNQLDRGLRFHNATGFTENDVCEDCRWETLLNYPLEYQNDSGSEDSFHGSGVLRGWMNSGSILYTDNDSGHGLIYEAPWDFTMFGAGPVLVANGGPVGVPIGVYGTVRLEGQPPMQLVNSTSAVVAHEGTLIADTAINNDNGRWQAAHQNVSCNSVTRYDCANGGQYRDSGTFRTSKSGYLSAAELPIQISGIVGAAGEAWQSCRVFAQVTSTGGTYVYFVLFDYVRSLVGGSLHVGTPVTISDLDTPSWGAPTVAGSGDNLGFTLTNANYTAPNGIQVVSEFECFRGHGLPWKVLP